jgi:hypothetical protein
MIGESLLVQAVDVLFGDAIRGWLRARRGRKALLNGVAAAIEDVVANVFHADTGPTVLIEGTEVVCEADGVANELVAAFHQERSARHSFELVNLRESWRTIATAAWTRFAQRHETDVGPMVDRFVETLSLHVGLHGGDLGEGLARQAAIFNAGDASRGRDLPAADADADLRTAAEVVEAVKLYSGFAMDDLLITWTNSADRPLRRVGFWFQMRSVEYGTTMAEFDSGSAERWVTLRAGEARVWSLLQLLLSNPTHFRTDLQLKTIGDTVYIGHPRGFVIDMDAYQYGAASRRLEAKFGWLVEDPFHWPIVNLVHTEFDSPS